MSRRSARGVIHTAEVLEKLRVGRAGSIDVVRQAKIGSKEQELAKYVIEAIDDLAARLTGDETYFHDKPAATPRREER